MHSIHNGSCHCGRLSVEFATSITPKGLAPRACQCSFCLKHAAVYLSDPKGSIALKTSGLILDTYRFGLGITDFHTCHQCGILVAATWEDRDGMKFGVVNARALDLADAFTSGTVTANFDGEGVEDREARRRKTWTPVSISTSER